MALKACICIHPYTARKDLGFGHDRYAYELIRQLPGAGVDPTVFESGLIRSMTSAGIKEVSAVARLISGYRAQVYHATATLNAMAPITARRHPLVTSILDVLWFFVRGKYDSRIKYWLKSYAIRRAAKDSDAIIVPFPSQRDFLINELKTPASRIHMIGFGIDQDQFYPPRPGEVVPRPAFMPAEGRLILFVGALTLGKGIDTLIRAMPEVLRLVPDAVLIVGSKGWHEQIVKDLWEQSPARDRIRLAGFIPENELRAAYIHARVTCFPSRYGFGLAVGESMACGTPTVSGRTLDGPEYVGDAGLLVDPNDPDELADALVRALNDDALHADLRRKGLEKTCRETWQETARLTAEVYRTLV
jgi:glycosyltransferase involved in cell wall biosynthesis